MVQSNGERILHSWEEKKACSLRALPYEKQGVLPKCSQNGGSQNEEAIGAMLSPTLSSLPVDASVPTYDPFRKCTCSRDFHDKLNQENYYQADNISEKEMATIESVQRAKNGKILRENRTPHTK